MHLAKFLRNKMDVPSKYKVGASPPRGVWVRGGPSRVASPAGSVHNINCGFAPAAGKDGAGSPSSPRQQNPNPDVPLVALMLSSVPGGSPLRRRTPAGVLHPDGHRLHLPLEEGKRSRPLPRRGLQLPGLLLEKSLEKCSLGWRQMALENLKKWKT